MFYTLPLSLKILLNLCLLSCKKKKSANCQILKSEVKSLKYSVVFFLYYCISHFTNTLF